MITLTRVLRESTSGLRKMMRRKLWWRIGGAHLLIIKSSNSLLNLLDLDIMIPRLKLPDPKTKVQHGTHQR